MNAPVAFLPAPVPISMLPKAGVSPVPVPAATDLIPLAIWDANKLGTGVGGWRTAATTINQLFASASGLGPFGPAGPTHSVGLVPDPGSVAGLGRALFDDGTWKTVLTATNPTLTGKLTVNNNAVQPTAVFNSQVASTGISTLQVNQDWSGVSSTNIIASFTSYGDPARFVIRTANGSQANPTQTLAGNTLGAFGFRGYLTTGFATSSSGNIVAVAQENFTISGQGTNLAFSATVPAGSAVWPMAITGNGVNIGIAGNLNLGVLQSDSLLTINANTAPTLSAPANGTLVHVVGADSPPFSPAISIDAFNGPGVFSARHALGTNAGKTPSTFGSVLAAYQAMAWDGTTYNTITNIRQIAAEDQSTSHRGGLITFAVVPTGSTLPVTEIMRISGSGVNISLFPPAATVSDAPLTVIANTIPSASPPSPGAVIHAVGVDVSPARIVLDSVGGVASFQGRRLDGHMTAINPVAANVGILNHGAQAWDGSAFQPTCSTQWATAEAQDATHHGSYISFFTTALALGAFTTAPEVLRVQPSGGLSVGSANVASDRGNGAVFANSFMSSVTGTGGGFILKGSAGLYPGLTTSNSGNYTVIQAPDGTQCLQARDNTGGDAEWTYLAGDRIQFSNRAISANYAAFTSTGLAIQLSGGANVAAADALLTVNMNTAATVAAPANGAVMHIVGADAPTFGPTINIDSFGTVGGFIHMRNAWTSNAAKSPTANGTVISGFQSSAWDGSAYNVVTNIRCIAAESQSPTNHGSMITFATTPTTTAAGTVECMRVQPSGGLSVGSANVAVDVGNGVVLSTRLQTTLYSVIGSSIAPAAGGVGTYVCFFGSTSIGLFLGTGAPTASATKGSLYIQTDATTATSRLWINTNGSTTWANFTASA